MAVIFVVQRIAENRVNTVCKHYCRARGRVQLLVMVLFYYFNIKAVAEYLCGFFCKRRYKIYAERHIKCEKYRNIFSRRAYFFSLRVIIARGGNNYGQLVFYGVFKHRLQHRGMGKINYHIGFNVYIAE